MSVQDHSDDDKWTETRVRAISRPDKLVQPVKIPDPPNNIVRLTDAFPDGIHVEVVREPLGKDPEPREPGEPAPFVWPHPQLLERYQSLGYAYGTGDGSEPVLEPAGEPGPIIREHYPIDPDVLTVGKRPKGSV